mmetsp:Transcript_16008/g.27106  ORF Transcript_16008/g.27106 Transcript_16008/m.27106 type:complete len:127 (-) Transcript_16008:285-665(-)|eukprot:CAMPEP_0116560482 /NCGR_PEP_ID=MMETSP0397-20121206/11019_1 /TAXON_ID=216820 /ORGANISM="Cyclophora tenuis, Strain ECT3854" /LENGTH=126 /DNA_ID=CAMNT_0004086453 /DNA_START=70 /DNA_END=450 /DNA_ORIENTATION=+
MTSRIIDLLRFLGPRATRTLNQPNAWATISLWRRFFQLQEDERLEEQREIEEILDEIFSAPTMRPIATQENHDLRATVLEEHYRDLREQGAAYQARMEALRLRELQQIRQPNLAIPNGDTYVSLPQ